MPTWTTKSCGEIFKLVRSDPTCRNLLGRRRSSCVFTAVWEVENGTSELAAKTNLPQFARLSREAQKIYQTELAEYDEEKQIYGALYGPRQHQCRGQTVATSVPGRAVEGPEHAGSTLTTVADAVTGSGPATQPESQVSAAGSTPATVQGAAVHGPSAASTAQDADAQTSPVAHDNVASRATTPVASQGDRAQHSVHEGR